MLQEKGEVSSACSAADVACKCCESVEEESSGWDGAADTIMCTNSERGVAIALVSQP